MNYKKKRNNYIIIGVLIVAALLRLLALSAGDSLTDEVLYGFRAIGMLDFDEAKDQTTPLEWFDEHGIPWWTHLSFHDHPPLVFLAQNFSMRIFGDTNFGFRFPSVVFGVASVWLLYLIGRGLYSVDIGLIAAGILAVTVNHVYISRTGLQEAQVIFFLLLASYFFIESLRRDSYLIWTGVALGLGFLTKYTTFVLVPIFLLYLLFFRREYFRNKKLWLGAALSIVIFSPVILYNIELYRAVGHFDFQFSFIARQNPKEWQIQPGKEIGSVWLRISEFVPRLWRSNSWVLIVLFFTSFVGLSVACARNRQRTFRAHGFLIVAIALVAFYIIFAVGPSFRFLSMLTPFMVLAVAVFLSNARTKFSHIIPILFVIFLVFEVVYSINSQIVDYPYGREVLAYSPVNEERYPWGYNELGNYFARELDGKMPAQVFDMRYKFLDALHDRTVKENLAKKLPRYSAIIIYDANMQKMAQLWVLDRLNIYHAWPVVNTEQYLTYLRDNGVNDITQGGFERHYFVRATDNVWLLSQGNRSQIAAQFEQELLRVNIIPEKIYNKKGKEVFRIYKF